MCPFLQYPNHLNVPPPVSTIHHPFFCTEGPKTGCSTADVTSGALQREQCWAHWLHWKPAVPLAFVATRVQHDNFTVTSWHLWMILITFFSWWQALTLFSLWTREPVGPFARGQLLFMDVSEEHFSEGETLEFFCFESSGEIELLF